jgi:valyl-tRNA synthetase
LLKSSFVASAPILKYQEKKLWNKLLIFLSNKMRNNENNFAAKKHQRSDIIITLCSEFAKQSQEIILEHRIKTVMQTVYFYFYTLFCVIRNTMYPKEL